MADEGTDEEPVVDPTVVVAALWKYRVSSRKYRNKDQLSPCINTHDVAEEAALDCEMAAAPPMQALLEEA
jgi:hypothetical protein